MTTRRPVFVMGITGSSSVFKHLSSKIYIHARVWDKTVSDGAADEVLRERFNIRTLESSPEVGRSVRITPRLDIYLSAAHPKPAVFAVNVLTENLRGT